MFEAVAVVMWRCRTHAIRSDPEALTVLSFISNARTYGGSTTNGYYGNCVVWRLPMATTREVADGNVMELIKLIKAAKCRVPDQSDMDVLLRLSDWYNLVRLTCWRSGGVQAVDFGTGGPARVMPHWQPQSQIDLPKCTACFTSMGDYNVLSTFVKEGHASAILHELEDMHRNYFYYTLPSKM